MQDWRYRGGKEGTQSRRSAIPDAEPVPAAEDAAEDAAEVVPAHTPAQTPAPKGRRLLVSPTLFSPRQRSPSTSEELARPLPETPDSSAVSINYSLESTNLCIQLKLISM